MYGDIVGRDMSDTERQEETLSQRVVKEAVDRGMESPLRETIIEAVNESEDEEESVPKVPFGAAMLGVGGALGYLLGIRNVQQSERESYAMAPSKTSETVDEAETDAEPDAEAEPESESSGGSWFKRIALLAGIGAAVVLIRSKLRSSDQEEWEPIEEFETTVPTSDEPEIIGEEDEDESEVEGEGEAIEIDTGEEEAETDSEDLDDARQDETDLEEEEKEE